MIHWSEAARGSNGLRIYRVEAHSESFSSSKKVPSPLSAVLERFETPTSGFVRERFAGDSAPVAASSFAVFCHIISLPDHLVVSDSTYRTTAPEVFPGVLEAICRAEGRSLGERPIQVVYTHAHFDHAGGHVAVEALGTGAQTLAHPYTKALFALSRREMFLHTRAFFFRDCEITVDPDELGPEIREFYLKRMSEAGVNFDKAPWGSIEEGPLRVDRTVDPELDAIPIAGGRVELLRFDGHIPGHLCLVVDRSHLITGDMWLPATTSLVTPGAQVALAGIPEETCGVLQYLSSDTRLLGLDVDDFTSFPSHEVVFRNPKRMAMRDLEIFAERLPVIYSVLGEHRARPMRVLDLAWGGSSHFPIWKIEGSAFRLVVAHDEAAAWVQDLVALGDLEEVEPERWIWTGRHEVSELLSEALQSARQSYSHLEFRSRGRETAQAERRADVH